MRVPLVVRLVRLNESDEVTANYLYYSLCHVDIYFAQSRKSLRKESVLSLHWKAMPDFAALP